MPELLDLLLAGMDQPQADQPNSLAEGPPAEQPHFLAEGLIPWQTFPDDLPFLSQLSLVAGTLLVQLSCPRTTPCRQGEYMKRPLVDCLHIFKTMDAAHK
eukprot:1155781-Pelagomonas_calceolata.AAC.2